MKLGLSFCLLLLLEMVICTENKIKETFGWKMIDYDFASDESRLEAIANQKFIPRNNVPFGIEPWNNKLFITVPRREAGVVSTLNYVYLDTNDSSPLLIPYPNWESNHLDNGTITSVFRLNVDVCDRLWLVDTGSVRNFESEGIRIREPSIQIFDLNTDTVRRKHVIQSKHLECDAVFTNIVVDVPDGRCNEAFAYIADPSSGALLVYNYRTDDSWRISHPYFRIDPLSTDFRIGDLSFQWDDGIFGIALTSSLTRGEKFLLFHPMASTLEFAISVDYLNNKTIKTNNEHYKILGTRGQGGQSGASAYDDKSGVYFYSLVNRNSVACWNVKKYFDNYSFNTTQPVLQDDERLIYISDMEVNERTGDLWIISNRLPINLYRTMDYRDINFRVFRRSIGSLIKGTVCENIRAFWSKMKKSI